MKKLVIITSLCILFLFGTFFATNALAEPFLGTWHWIFNMSTSSCKSYFKVVSSTPNSVCTLGGVQGKFEGGGESGYVVQEGNPPVWVFRGHSCQPGVKFWVRCFKIYGT